jgi:carbon monoxide dehydrogenase subunit G
MIEQELAVMLQQPPERAFDFFVDFPNEPIWNPECRRVEKTSDGPIGVGTTYTGRMRRVGQVKTEIVALDRPKAFSTVERSHGAEGTFDFHFTPYDGGTRVEVAMRLQPRGPMRLLERLMRRMMAKMVADLAENMRRGIDAADRARQDPSVA